MDRAYLLEVARRASGLTQAELAARSGTSQATVSAYERGLKSPTIKVAGRILEAAGYDLNLRRLIDWVEHEAPGVGHFWVPSTLWHVETPDCFAILAFPDLIGDGPMREWDMHDRAQRKGVYEQLLQGGSPEEMIRWIDGPLLVDVWEELELPDAVREAWKWPIVIARDRPTRTPCGSWAEGTTRSRLKRGSADTKQRQGGRRLRRSRGCGSSGRASTRGRQRRQRTATR